MYRHNIVWPCYNRVSLKILVLIFCVSIITFWVDVRDKEIRHDPHAGYSKGVKQSLEL